MEKSDAVMRIKTAVIREYLAAICRREVKKARLIMRIFKIMCYVEQSEKLPDRIRTRS